MRLSVNRSSTWQSAHSGIDGDASGGLICATSVKSPCAHASGIVNSKAPAGSVRCSQVTDPLPRGSDRGPLSAAWGLGASLVLGTKRPSRTAYSRARTGGGGPACAPDTAAYTRTTVSRRATSRT